MRPWVWVCALVIGAPAACIVRHSIPDEQVTYRMVATVEDNGRLVRGQSVRRYTSTPGGIFELSRSRDVGDSVIVPVRGRLLVVTHARWFAGGDSTCMGRRSSDGGSCGAILAWRPIEIFERGGQDGPVELEPNEYPVLVTFNGAPTLRSVVAVDPDRLEEPFGPGVTLRSITITRTSGPISQKQAKQLPFVNTLTGSLSCRVEELPNDGPWTAESQTKNPSLLTCISEGFF